MKKQYKRSWKRLDNAAKIFPSTSSSLDTKVFRVACELKEDIDPSILSQALEHTVISFPNFLVVLKRGLFWYYLESSKLRPIVKLETENPCSVLYNKRSRNLLFEVTYYHRRINLEVYHALSDGTGAIMFLRTLVYHYLRLKYFAPDQLTISPLADDASLIQKWDDSFSKNYVKSPKRKVVQSPSAYHLKGDRFEGTPTRIIEGRASVKRLLEETHKHQTTLTIFLSSVFALAISQDMSAMDKTKPVAITVPVNLRPYFSSATSRNFFTLINVGYDFSQNAPELADIIKAFHTDFNAQLNKTKLSGQINSLSALEHDLALSIVPLGIKSIALKIANRLAENQLTAAISNLGKINMPPELEPYIVGFDFFVSSKRLQLCVCSFKDRLTMSFSSSFVNTEVQKNFFRLLTSMGIEVEITTNLNHQLERSTT